MTLEIPSLGRPFCLGMLYDGRNEKLIPGITLWNKEDLDKHISTTSHNSTDFDILTSDTFSEKSSAMNISGELKISLWSGMINLRGSGKYLRDTKESKKQTRVTLKYTRTTKFEQLSMDHLSNKNITHQDVISKGIATHVVTGILYGAQAFFVFDKTETTSVKERTGEGKLEIEHIIKKLGELKGNLQMKKNEKEIASKLSCKFYGDFVLEKNPVTYEEAVNIYASLPKLLGENGERAVPMKVWLYPLKYLDNTAARLVQEISDNLVFRTETIIDQMSEVVMECNDMMRHPAAIIFPVLGDKISQFRKLFEHYRLVFLKQISEVIPSVRSGEIKESTLENVLIGKEKSPFRDKNTKEFLRQRQQEMEFVHSFLKQLSRFTTVSEDRELTKAILDPDFCYTSCFNFSSLSRKDSYLSHLESWLYKEKRDLHDNFNVADIKQWYKDEKILRETRELVRIFISVAEQQVLKKHQFLVTCVEDKAYPRITLLFYKSGQLVAEKCLPPAKPNNPEIGERTAHTIDFIFRPADYGIETIGGYVVVYKRPDEKDLSFTLASVKDKFVTVSGLKENSTYYFRYAACHNEIYSECSDEVKAKTKPKSPA